MAQSTGTDSSTGAVVGGAVGGVAVIVAAIAAGVYFAKKKRGEQLVAVTKNDLQMTKIDPIGSRKSSQKSHMITQQTLSLGDQL